jgi:hypothetical protein
VRVVGPEEDEDEEVVDAVAVEETDELELVVTAETLVESEDADDDVETLDTTLDVEVDDC